MNKLLKIVLSGFAVLVLVSCSGGETNENLAVADGSESQDGEEFDFRGETSLQTQLLMGSLMLEDTELAITPEQAEELLPLWNLTKSMSESGTAVQEEFDAVMDAIQVVMTTEQLSFIEGIEFEPGQTQELMAEMGIVPDNDGDGKVTGGFGGGIPGQGPGGGGQGVPGENISPEQQATLEAMREEGDGRGGNSRANVFLIEGLIAILEGKLE